MSTELTTIDFAEKIRDRVRQEFINLIPDKEWDRLIKQTVHDFTHDKVSSYNRKNIRAPIKDLMEGVLKEKAKERFTEALSNVRDVDLEKMLKVTLTPEVLSQAVLHLVSTLLAKTLRGGAEHAATMLIKECCGRIVLIGQDCPQCGNIQYN